MDEALKPRIVWMLDEVIAESSPATWDRIESLETELIKTVGKEGLKHEIVRPQDCLPNVVSKLQGKKFSCILDLTGWLGSAISEAIPPTHIEKGFSMSRVRIVSSPKLETTGYTISLSISEIVNRRQQLDLSSVLVLDDVSFSGWTSRKTMELWGIDPKNSTHAFLIANTGNFGLNKPGAVKQLELKGCHVIFGHELKTPLEDGWHLKDLHKNPQLEQSFVLASLFQEIFKNGGGQSESVQNFFNNETVIRTLFPQHLTSEQIRSLHVEGKFILQNNHIIETHAIHARNPFLWASPYFAEHIDTHKLITHKEAILATLGEMARLTTDPESTTESANELRRIVRGLIGNGNPERPSITRGERFICENSYKSG